MILLAPRCTSPFMFLTCLRIYVRASLTYAGVHSGPPQALASQKICIFLRNYCRNLCMLNMVMCRFHVELCKKLSL